MTWGIPTPVILQTHVALSLVGIATGFVALFGMITGRHLAAWTAIFQTTTLLTASPDFRWRRSGLIRRASSASS